MRRLELEKPYKNKIEYSRKTATKVLENVLQKIKEANKKDEFIYKITKAVLFGSYINSKKDKIGDLDIVIFFMFPLLVAIIHSIFGIKFCSYIIATFGNEQLLNSIIMTSVFIVVIYGGYFLITYLCSKNIIKEK